MLFKVFTGDVCSNHKMVSENPHLFYHTCRHAVISSPSLIFNGTDLSSEIKQQDIFIFESPSDAQESNNTQSSFQTFECPTSLCRYFPIRTLTAGNPVSYWTYPFSIEYIKCFTTSSGSLNSKCFY